MNNNPMTCDRARIELFLQQKLSDEEQVAFELHLDDCEDCRVQLEASAAGDDIWSGVRESLTAGPFSMEAEGQSSLELAESDEVSSTYDTVLKLLAPTDDERMLGRLGIYEVVGVIGSGGMGVVLKAYDPALNRYVAIKVLAPHLGSSGAARKRFSREAQAAAAVVHDNVIEIHGVADAGGLSYLVMPYVRGPSLQRRLDDDGSLALVEILRIGMQAAAGLAAAHAQGLVHRDVKPANILLAEGVERVKLTDFGLARAADDASLTRTGVIAGTPQYMSPEQARGELVDQRSDLFGLGCVLYAMCTGRAPFRAETSYAVLRRITDDEPRPIREINPDIPEWFCRIIEKLMSKRPDDRFESARQVAELLKECLAHVQQPSSVPLPKEVPRAQSATSATWLGSGNWRRRWGAIITAVALIGFGGAGAFMLATVEPSDISGEWTGEGWDRVILKSTGAATYSGTYTDTFGKEPGTIELKWSRIERRYNGTWSEGKDRFGKISVRPVSEEIRGAWTTNRKSNINPGTPELADLLWVRPKGKQDEKSVKSTLKFGPVIEHTLYDVATESSTTRIGPPPTMLDVEHDKLVMLTTSPADDDAVSWALNQGVDFVACHDAGASGLQIIGGIVVSPTQWGAEAGDVLKAVEDAERQLKEPLEIQIANLWAEKRPKAFYFKTRTGRIGVIEITHAEPSRSVTFRYKLILSDSSHANTNQTTERTQAKGNLETPGTDLKFGPVIEHTLDDITVAESTTTRGGRPTKMLDVEHDKLIIPPDSVVLKGDWFVDWNRGRKWARAHGADFFAFTDSGGCAVYVINGIVGLAQWDAKPGDILKLAEDTEQRWKEVGTVEPGEACMSPNPSISGPLPRKWDTSYFFKTRAGQIGVLQITDSEPKSFVTFRYKLIMDDPPRLKGQSLDEAIKRFNETARQSPIGKDQPPLTVDEVIASIRWLTDSDKQHLSAEDVKELNKIAEGKSLPSGLEISAQTTLQGNDGERFQAWVIVLRSVGQPIGLGIPEGNKAFKSGGTAYPLVHTIRQQLLWEINDANGNRVKLPTVDKSRLRDDATPLAAAINEFNARHKSVLDIPQPPLTEDEVVAAIRYWKARRNDSPVTNGEFAAFQEIAKTRQLPRGAEFELLTQFIDDADGSELTAWSVRIRMQKEGMTTATYAFVIRDQYIRWQSGKLKEAKIEWGPASPDGLQAGLRVIPELELYLAGLPMRMKPYFYYRNMGKRPLDLSFPKLMTHTYYKRIVTEDATGKEILFEQDPQTAAPVGWFQTQLQPGAIQEINGLPILFGAGDRGSAETAIRATPGQSVHLHFVLPNVAKSDGKPLDTGVVLYSMAAPAAGQQNIISELLSNQAEVPNAAGGSRPDEGIRTTNEELTQVTIPVEYEDGRPATGAEVTMSMQGNPARPVVVTGKSDAQGVAFNRNLPYGKYEMTIKVADGDTAYWSATLPGILLEFGGSFRQKIVAPTREKRATVKIHTAFNPAGLKGLRFGKYSGRQGSFVGVVWSPEPSKQDERFAHFPVLENGITSAALFMTMRVTRNIKQPSGATLDWYWMRGGDFDPDYLLVTDKSVIDFQELGWDGNVVYDLPEGQYFSNMPKGHGIQYFAFRDWQRQDNPLSLKLPPGKLECEVRGFYGKATAEVIQALGLAPQAGRGIWLEASLNGKSAWVPRGIDRSDWSPGKDINNVLGYKTLSLKSGETQAIRVASPDPSRVDGSGTTQAK